MALSNNTGHFSSVNSKQSSESTRLQRLQQKQLPDNKLKFDLHQCNTSVDKEPQRNNRYKSEIYIENHTRPDVTDSPVSPGKTYISTKTINMSSDSPPPIPSTSPPVTPPNTPIKELEPLDRLLKRFTAELLQAEGRMARTETSSPAKPPIKKVLVTRKSLPVLHSNPVPTVLLDDETQTSVTDGVNFLERKTEPQSCVYNNPISVKTGYDLNPRSNPFQNPNIKLGRSTSFQLLRPSDFVKPPKLQDNRFYKEFLQESKETTAVNSEVPNFRVKQVKESIESGRAIRRHASFNSELLGSMPRRSLSSSVPVKALVRKFSTGD